MPAQQGGREPAPDTAPAEGGSSGGDDPGSASPFFADMPELGREFRKLYHGAELAQLDLDGKADHTLDERVAYVRGLVQGRSAELESAAPSLSAMTPGQFAAHREALVVLASTYTQVGRWLPAHEVLIRLSEASETRDGKPDPGALNMLGRACERLGEYGEAERYYAQSLLLLRQRGVPDGPQVLSTMRGLMQALGKSGRIPEALDMNAKGHEAIRAMKGGELQEYERGELQAMDEVKDVLEQAKKAGKPVDSEWQPKYVDLWLTRLSA